MEAFDVYQNELVNNIKKTFSEFSQIPWLNPYQAIEKLDAREQLIDNAENWLFKHTKPYQNQISRGCMLCGLGKWSCLFITGKCNANCFYCPSSQVIDEPPGTQSFSFESPEAYADYINFFKFKGVSFSGGEPLLFFERMLHYLETIRKKCSPEIYTWMYTNGILSEPAKFKKLANAGLNEVRFDIGATGYQLDNIKHAQGLIPVITIEIPAIPEEKERLKQLLPKMVRAGVTNLNLHQLRLTKYNAPKLLQRYYTYLPAEQPIVLESEMAALEILDFVNKNHIDIGVNYCSFHFKNRFQKAGFRKQVANALAEPDDLITEKGFIRYYSKNSIGYKTIKISDTKPANNSCEQFQLPHKTFWKSLETAMRKTPIEKEEEKPLESLLKNDPDNIPTDPFLFKIWQMEYIEKTLRNY